MKKLNNSNKTEICLLLIIFCLTLVGFLLKKMFEIKSSMSVTLNMGDVVGKSIKSLNSQISASENTIVEGNISKTLMVLSLFL